MIATVVACGDSANGWTPRGITIGSNDCEKFGEPVDYLILANAPRKFGDRLKVIKATKAQVLVTSTKDWKPIFPNCKRIERLVSFNKTIMRGFVQSSVTTPIICISMAIKWGATEIIVWGLDMLNHKTYRVGTKAGDREFQVYCRFFKECERLKIKVWRGAGNTAFDNILPLWISPTGPDMEVTFKF